MQPHFVMKKGHLGRYRFALMEGSRRVTGEVHAESEPVAELRLSHALSEVGNAAKALQAAVDDMISKEKRRSDEALSKRRGSRIET